MATHVPDKRCGGYRCKKPGVARPLLITLAVIYTPPAGSEPRQASGLVIQVNPESHLDTPVASLSFQVNNPGEIAYSQPVTVTAWVRAHPPISKYT